MCWQDDGIVVGSTHSAFAEGVDLGTGSVQGAAIWTTQAGNGFGQPLTADAWRSGVTGEFSVGYWAGLSASACPWYIAADTDGFGGYPWTNVAPVIGYPTGRNHPAPGPQPPPRGRLEVAQKA